MSPTKKRLVLVQEVRSHAAAEGTAIVKAIRAAIAQEHEVHSYAILLVGPGSVPVTSSGKLAPAHPGPLLEGRAFGDCAVVFC
jgi:acyl-CoA synthetase (AMP-forming)/AMP-acid ligase II